MKICKDIRNPCVNSWNQMIKDHARSESPRNAVMLFNEMVAAGIKPDEFSYSFLLSGCAKSGLLREGEQLHGRALTSGYISNIFVKTNLVNLYFAGGDKCGVKYARRVFDDMGDRNVACWNSMLAGYMKRGDVSGARRTFDEMLERNVVSWTIMVSGYARNGKCKQALVLFNEMRRAGVELDQAALVAALSACAELGDLRSGRWMHSYIEKTLSGTRHSLSISLGNALIHMYAGCGMIEDAYEVLKWMPQRSKVSWTTMIHAFAKQGYAQEALAMFDLMQSLDAKEGRPDEITFLGILRACSLAGLVDEGRQFFTNMIQSWGIKPRIEHYKCMVELFSRAGLMDEACDVIENTSMEPNDALWSALIPGCMIHKDAEFASHMHERSILELDPYRSNCYLTPLADAYAIHKQQQDVAAVNQEMDEKGVKKPAGRSWIQINGVVHEFMAGGGTGKHASSVHEMLGKISIQVSYEPDI